MLNTQPSTLNPQYSKLNPESYQRIVRWALFRHHLGPVFNRLQEQHIEFLVLKGWAFAGDLYPDLTPRSISDVDLLLHPQDLQPVSSFLDSQGYHSVSPNPHFTNAIQFEKDWVPLELTYTNPQCISIDLHTHILPSAWSLPVYPIGMDDIWAASQTFTDWTGRPLQRLGWEHTILHLTTHILRHNLGSQSPQSYHDLDRLLRKYGNQINYESLMKTAPDWRLKTALYFTLRYCQELLATPFPPEWTHQHIPSPLRRKIITTLIPFKAVRTRQPIPWLSSILVKLLLIDRPIDIGKQILSSLFPTPATRYHITGAPLSLPAYWRKIITIILEK